MAFFRKSKAVLFFLCLMLFLSTVSGDVLAKENASTQKTGSTKTVHMGSHKKTADQSKNAGSTQKTVVRQVNSTGTKTAGSKILSRPAAKSRNTVQTSAASTAGWGTSAITPQTEVNMNTIKSIKIYYGNATNSAIAQLSTYNAVIIEPYAFTTAQVAQLQAKGIKVFGYLSVMELEAPNKALVSDSDYFYYHNQKYIIPQWNTYIMDLSKPHYQSVLMNKVTSEIAGKQMDGVFLDTVGDIDDYFYNDPQTQDQFRSAYKTLLEKIKSACPNLSLIQNWGFDTLKTTSGSMIHAVLWEDFSKSTITGDAWSQNWIRYFQRRTNLFRVITVSPDVQSAAYAKKIGFIPILNNGNIYNGL